jgi:hypothetical protein
MQAKYTRLFAGEGADSFLEDMTAELQPVFTLPGLPAAIITVLKKGARLTDVQRTARQLDPSTTKLHDRRGYNPEKAASFFATHRI